MLWTECAREIPKAAEYDVLVAGGGIAGVAAALAAARTGAKTCLIEKTCALGGLATLGLVTIYLPLCDGRGRRVAGGIAQELFEAAYRFGPDRYPHAWPEKGRLEAPFEAAPMMLALEEMLLRAGVALRYDTRICALHAPAGRIEGLITESKAGREGIGCGAVVDATGDADICRLAGEALAQHETRTAASWYMSFQQDHLQLMTHVDAPPGDALDYRDGTPLLLRERAQIRKDAAERKRRGEYPALIGLLPQFRKTCRLENGFVLTAADEGRSFPDAIGQIGDWRAPGPVYSLPYRMLPARSQGNLITAGRCVAVSEELWDVTRVIPACAVTGQAAGTAAAMAVARGADLRAPDVAALQEALRAQGALIPE